MMDAFLFVGLPYLALAVMIGGTVYRYAAAPQSVSSLSSQFLEGSLLRWASLPWHAGILVVLIGHLIPVFAPGLWQSLTSVPVFLIAVEAVGIVAAFLCLAGMAILLYRRLTSARLQAVTTPADLAVAVLLIAQVLLGIGVAGGYRWGAAWSTNTTTPYLWSLVTLQPQPEYILGLPPTVRMHLMMAWIIFLLVPFTRLAHLFAFPLHYLWRPPIKVVWTNARRFARAAAPAQRSAEDSRRHFLRGAAASGTAGALLGVGVLDKLAQYFRGPAMGLEEEAELLQKKLERLELAAHERALEIERIKNQYIFVANLAELKPKDGKYFIDYQMRPALAFKSEDGLPLLISAKCTHLGCTVASTLDAEGRLLCPCHVSYFDVKTGAPNPGAPAKAPLPRLGWALMDAQGSVVASQGPDGVLQGAPDPAQLDRYAVYIAKQYEEIA